MPRSWLRPASRCASTPVGGAEQDDREVMHLVRLDQRERLKELVHGAESSRKDEEGLRILDEHGFADEEEPEVDRHVDIGIETLLDGQLDGAADGERMA